MAFDFNTAGPQREFGAVIPDGTFVWAVGVLRDGAFTPPWASPQDQNLFRTSKEQNSDAVMLDWEFTIQFGPHKNQKFWQLMTLDGGQRDDHGQSKAGNISKTTIRAMIESARGIRPDDLTPAAVAGRQVEFLRQLDNIPFACKIGVRDGGSEYPDSNQIAIVITPDMPEYAAIRNGQEVAPQPTGIRKRTGTGAGTGAAGGQQGGGWAAAPPAQPALPMSPPPAPLSPPPPPAAAAGWGNSAGGAQQQPAPASPPAAGPKWVTG